MPASSEAARLNLDFYRKQAKSLLKSAQSGDPAALNRISRQTSGLLPGSVSLHHAQLAVAREQGFSSWPRFRAFIVQSALDFQDVTEAFIRASLSNLKSAASMLAQHPNLAGAGFYAALVLGERARVEDSLRQDPALLSSPGGPMGYEPIAYVCFSHFASPASPRADALVETARLLIRRGANPNTAIVLADWPANPLPCLYAATGLNNNPALALTLLEAGANPNDGESLYHSTEHADLGCMKLLLRHGATPDGSNALKHILDREDPEGLRLLLSAGADPNEVNGRDETALHWGVWRGRSAGVIAALLDCGATIDARRDDGRTAYALAVQSGQKDTVALLAARGANLEVSALDRFLGACTAAREDELNRLLAENADIAASPGAARLLPDFAASHRTAAVRALLAAGFFIGARGELGATALHWACWKGYADLVEILLEHGASLTTEDHQFHGTPAGWFAHGVRNCGEGLGDYAQVARLLLAAGASLPGADLPTGDAAVDAVLRDHGLVS
jgi:ankyrin repeat protein